MKSVKQKERVKGKGIAPRLAAKVPSAATQEQQPVHSELRRISKGIFCREFSVLERQIPRRLALMRAYSLILHMEETQCTFPNAPIHSMHVLVPRPPFSAVGWEEDMWSAFASDY